MTCDRCQPSKDAGMKFCPYCGMPLDGTYYYAYRRMPSEGRGFVFNSGLVAAIIFSAILVFELFAVLIKTGYILDDIAGKSYPLYYITPHIETLFTLNDVGVMALCLFEIAVIILCVSVLFYKCARHLRDNKFDLKSLEKTAAYEMPVIMSIFFLAEFVFLFYLMLSGTDLGAADLDDSGFMIFQYINASVYEEFLCRILMLGLPCLVVGLLAGKRETPWWKYLVGGFKFEKWMIIFVLFSAYMFGAAHLDNWASWKFIPTFLFGLVAGYLFIKYGVYATIAVHFFNDALSADMWVFGTTGYLMLLLLMAGMCSLPHVVKYAKNGYDAIRSLKKGS